MDLNTNLVIFTGVGSILPDAIRFAKEKTAGKQAYFTSIVFYVGLLVQIGLGFLAYYLTHPVDVKQALAIGYAGPALFTTLLGAATNNGGPNKGVSSSGLSQILSWWRK